MRSTLQPAFILHTHPFNETSLLLEAFTESNGRISLLAKGVRVGQRSRYRGLLRPFVPLCASWAGKTELMSLSAAELNGIPFDLTGNALFSGIYLNELLVRVLPRFDAYPKIFQAYRHVLSALQMQAQAEASLRLFEKTLLAELGYGFALDRESINGQTIQLDGWYEFIPGVGLNRCEFESHNAERIFSGKSLLALHKGQLEDADDLRAAKRLHRIAITALLGNKRLRSRELFAGVCS